MNTRLLTWLTVLIMGFAVNTNAAIVLKKHAPAATSSETVATTVTNVPAETATEATTATTATSEVKAVKKHSFISRLFTGTKAALTGKAAIPAAAYIILCIFALGWLAIGLNDNFSGFSWILSLILYIIFYIPGLIYSLIMMGNYY